MSLSPNTEAILLLCGHFEGGGDLKPLTTGQYYALAGWLERHGRQPHSLLDTFDDLDELEDSGLDRDHILRLLDRGPALALSVERWLNHGLWVISCADRDYPTRYRERLANLAPPILYGAGDTAILERGGLAIVGSRKVDDDGKVFAGIIAGKAARDGVTVISGGAKGVDLTAMLGALEAGGRVVGVLADNLVRATVKAEYRDAIRNREMLLLCPFSPNTGFFAGNAMSRNKLIYALADWALVIDTSIESGGTWTGATENLKNRWTPLFVRTGSQTPPGNQRLLAKGGIALEETAATSDTQLPGILTDLVTQANPGVATSLPDGPPSDTIDPGDAIFDAVWPHIAAHLDSPRDMKSLQAELGSSISPRQLQIWIARAVQDGLIERKTGPVRYQLKQPDPSQPIQQALDL